MGIQDFGTIEANASLKQVINALADLQDTLNFLLNGNLDLKNVRANSITADRLKVTELSAISANLGHITAGLIEAVQIFGSYIATSTGYPRTEMSTTGNQFAAYQTANSYVKMNPASTGSNPGFNFKNGTADGLAYMLPNDLFMATPGGSANVQVSAGKDLFLTANKAAGYSVKFAGWDSMKNTSSNRTLQQDLDSKQNAIFGLNATIVVVTDVDFAASSATYHALQFVNGILTTVT